MPTTLFSAFRHLLALQQTDKVSDDKWESMRDIIHIHLLRLSNEYANIDDIGLRVRALSKRRKDYVIVFEILVKSTKISKVGVVYRSNDSVRLSKRVRHDEAAVCLERPASNHPNIEKGVAEGLLMLGRDLSCAKSATRTGNPRTL